MSNDGIIIGELRLVGGDEGGEWFKCIDEGVVEIDVEHT
jgi:hypothetical protein